MKLQFEFLSAILLQIPDLSSKKLIDAGFLFNYGMEKMIDDAIECCQEKGYL